MPKKILQYGKGTMLAKIDIQSAFCLLPVHPEDHHLLTMSWKGGYTSTTVSSLAYNRLQNCLTPWLISFHEQQKAGESYLIHYLDDYLTMWPPQSQICQHSADIFTSLCKGLGITLATDKLEGPATSLSFLGIILYTCCMEIRLPADKLSRMQEMIKAWFPS